jgi:two-component system, chemotaxis family, chemotaxis protein CheY
MIVTETSMSTKPTKSVGLVGHCGPDTSYLIMAVEAADENANIVRIHNDKSLEQAIHGGVSLLLVNRALEPGFPDATGIELIDRIRQAHPDARMMLVSNYPDAQAAAEKVGAIKGFGKNDLRSEKASKLIAAALAEVTV